jgi:hypothetical protein
MRVGRNDTCPCGSGRKYKSCCAGKTDRPKGLIVLLAMFAVIAGIAFIPRGDKAAKSTPLPPAPIAAATKPGPQPPGPVPPGKVWSAEHGHWHDIARPGTSPASSIKVEPGRGLQTNAPLTPVVGNAPQPPGPVPPGKVWSPEHGHWHDAK